MRALVTEPGVGHSTRVEDLPEPRGDTLLRVLEVGVCGTDREIAHGLFGNAPDGDRMLVLGHELLAEVVETGELVTATVRRSCRHCIACDDGSPDSCLTGDYEERGITRLHGFARELVAEDASQLIPVPRSLGRLGVLAEPTSICERALRHARAIGNREPWRLQRALVLGAGSIGTIAALLLRLDGVEVTVASLEEGAPVVEAAGATYAHVNELDELGRFDLVVECAGNAELAARSLGLLRRNGVACLLGIDGRDRPVEIDGPTLAVQTILQNNVLFGSVNAHRIDWEQGVADLTRLDPELLRALIGLRVPLEEFERAFAHRGGKATLLVA